MLFLVCELEPPARVVLSAPQGGGGWEKRRRGCARAACRTLSSGDEPLIFVRDGDFVSTFQTFTAPVRGPAVIVGFFAYPLAYTPYSCDLDLLDPVS